VESQVFSKLMETKERWNLVLIKVLWLTQKVCHQLFVIFGLQSCDNIVAMM